MPFLRPQFKAEWLIVGLGNPGREHSRTRHNVGFWVVDAFARKYDLKWIHSISDSAVAVGRIGEYELALAKPRTYMNASGRSVRPLLRRFSIDPTRLIVVQDDLDMAVGKLRLRDRGSSGGHRGISSIISDVGADTFYRIKLGIGRPDPKDAADYVLSEFSPDQRDDIDDAVDKAVAMIEECLAQGPVVKAAPVGLAE